MSDISKTTNRLTFGSTWIPDGGYDKRRDMCFWTVYNISSLEDARAVVASMIARGFSIDVFSDGCIEATTQMTIWEFLEFAEELSATSPVDLLYTGHCNLCG